MKWAFHWFIMGARSRENTSGLLMQALIKQLAIEERRRGSEGDSNM